MLISLYPFIYFLIKNPKNHRLVHNIRKWGCRFTLFLTGIRYEKIGPQHWHEPVIFCTNHSSSLDIILTIAALDNYHHYLGKRELADIPFFGIFFKYMDIPVERGTKAGLYKAYQQAEKDLKKGINLVIFPEGTTHLKSPEMVAFKQGAFKMAVSEKVPIVPIAFLDHWHMMHYDKKWQAKPGKSRLIFHEPLMPKNGTEEEVKRLREETYKAIDQTLKHYYPNENRQRFNRQDSRTGEAAV